MNEKIEIEQTWWEIEDILKPEPLRNIKQFMDIYTVDNILKMNLREEKTLNLKIWGRYPKKELAFIEDNLIFVNLGNLNEWPDEIKNEGKRKQVGLKIEYDQFVPGFKFERYKFWKGYTGSFIINEPIKPKFSIIIPKGMVIPNKGMDIKLHFYQINKNQVDRWELEFEPPAITSTQGKKSYHYIITGKDYKKIIDTPNDCKMRFKVIYKVDNEKLFLGIPVFATILIFLSLFEIHRVFTEHQLGHDTALNPTFLIVVLSFIAIVFSLYRENYEIPASTFVAISIIITIISIVTGPLLYIDHLI